MYSLGLLVSSLNIVQCCLKYIKKYNILLKKEWKITEFFNKETNRKIAQTTWQARKKYRIGHDKLRKVWNGTEKNTVTKESMPYTTDKIMPCDQQPDLQNIILKEVHSPENVVYNLEIIAEQSRKHTNMISRILEKQGEQKMMLIVCRTVGRNQEYIAEEEKQKITLEDIGSTVAGFKTLMYAYMGIMAAISVLVIIWKHKDPQTTQTPLPTHIKPAKEPKRPNMFNETPDPFEM